MGTESEKLVKLFQAYIGPRKVLVADESASSRAGLAKMIIDLGAKPNHVVLASSYAVAEQEMDRVKPHVVVCDYDLGRGMGLTLLQAQRRNRPQSKDSLFVLVTGNTSQSAVAQAAEEDIDTYIVKPYTIETIRQSIVKAAITKVYPNDYQKTVEEGKKQLFEGKVDEAMKTFDKAITLNPKPTLACFYRGQAHLIKQAVESAEGSYNEGLGYNKIHYKCLVGLYDLMMQKSMYAEAYDVVKKISRYFPANPQRLASVLRLAIMTKSYDDIESYYRVFTNLDQRNEEITKYICAALTVCGKYYLQRGLPSRALELFSKAAVSASGRTKVLKEIVSTLVEFDLVKDAEVYLGRFPPNTQSMADFLTAEYLVLDRKVSVSKTIETGRKLISQNVEDPIIYRILLKRSLEASLKDAADTLLKTAVQKWPQLAKDFQQVTSDAMKSRADEEQAAAAKATPDSAK